MSYFFYYSRFDNAKEEDFEKKRSQAIIRAQVQKQLEEEKKTQEEIDKLKVTYGKLPCDKIVQLQVGNQLIIIVLIYLFQGRSPW